MYFFSYIELKVSTSTESSPRKSNGPKSARRKNKKTRRNSNENPWLNLPYADMGYLENKHGGDGSSSSNKKSTIRTKSATTTSENEFATRASDLENVCR